MRAGVSLRSVTLWEGGMGEPTLRKVHRLAEALGVSAGWLLGEDPRVAVSSAEESAPRYQARTSLIISRMSELTDNEYGRLEPVVLGMVEAILACRNDAILSSAAKDRIGEMAKAVVDGDIEMVRAAQAESRLPKREAATQGSDTGIDALQGSNEKRGRSSN
jgi:transcriptional regulator with XRE-family HTH domain